MKISSNHIPLEPSWDRETIELIRMVPTTSLYREHWDRQTRELEKNISNPFPLENLGAGRPENWTK
jgi:hypothetical protein